MRIDDSSRMHLDRVNYQKRSDSAQENRMTESDEAGSSQGTTSRTERLESLKVAMSQNKGVDLGKLANTLLSTGIFFDEKA